MATATTPPVTAKTTTSVDPLYTQAVNQAKTALAAQIAPIQAEQAGSDAQFKQQQTDATGNAQALSDLLAKLAPAVQSNYTTAAQNDSLLANGFSAGVKDAIQGNTDSLNGMLSSLGSPAQIDSHAGQVADVLQGLGGYIPGRAIDKTGAAFGALANILPGTALLQGQENVKSLQAQSNAADVGFQNKIAELAGKLPGDVQTNYEKLQTMALNNAKFAEQVKNNAFNRQYKVNQLAEQMRRDQTTAYYKGVSAQQAQSRLILDGQKFARQQFQQDRMYAVSLQRLGISQKNLQLRIAANAYKQAHGGYSQKDIMRFNQKLDALVASAGKLTHASTTTNTYNYKGNGSSTVTDREMPTPTPVDKNGKPIKINPTTGQPISKPAGWINNNTYANFIKGALKKGVPIQLVIQRANTIWPETERGDLGSLMQLPAVAAQAAKQSADYNQMTGVTLGTAPNGTPITWSAPKGLSSSAKKAVGNILNLTSEYLGTPYAWGGESPTGFDCSGLAQYVYAKSGVSIPRTTYDQWQQGFSVGKSQLQPGDLVFFKGSDAKTANGQLLPGHVGIYIGNGKMIDAPHTGSVVKVDSVNSFGGYMGARRYVR